MNDNHHTYLALGKFLVKPGLRDMFRKKPHEALIAAGVDPAAVDITRVENFLQRFLGDTGHADQIRKARHELLTMNNGVVK